MCQGDPPLARRGQAAQLRSWLCILGRRRAPSTRHVPRILLLLLLEKHLLFYLLLVELLRGSQVEVVDDVRDVGDAVLLRGSSTRSRKRRIAVALVSHILRVGLARGLPLGEAIVAHVLHARQRVLLLVICRDVGGTRLIQAAGTLEPLMVASLLLRVRGLPLA